MAAKDAAMTVLFHLLVRLWTAFAVHEKQNSVMTPENQDTYFGKLR
jgi:hypothetical protein